MNDKKPEADEEQRRKFEEIKQRFSSQFPEKGNRIMLPVPHGMKRFKLRSGSEVAEGVVFSDDMAVVYGKSIQAFLTEEELIVLFPGAAIEWIDK